MIGLGLDSGGTRCRWRLADAAGKMIGGGEAPAISGHVFTPEEQAGARKNIAALAALVTAAAHPSAIVAGMTGVDAQSPASLFMRAAFAEAFDIASANVSVISDVETAFHAAFAPGDGYLIYAGTGSVGCFIETSGECTVIGGRGAAIDDAGAAYWIAMRALRAVLRLEDGADGAGWRTPMGQRFAKIIGATDWPGVRGFVYGQNRGGVGLLALGVAEAAKAGDTAALAIFAGAGRELARLGAALIQRFGPRAVAATGGALRLHPLIFDSLKECLGAGVDCRSLDCDAALAAARLAVGCVTTGAQP